MSDSELLLQLAACGEMSTTESPMNRMSLDGKSRRKVERRMTHLEQTASLTAF